MRPAVEHDDVTGAGVYVDGNELRYLRAGEGNGDPVLLLHGGIVDAAHLSWGSAIGPLAADHDVYALDLLGYGLSDAPRVRYTMDRHVETVAGFMEVAGLESAHVVGTSLGGGIGIQLALEYPERVEKLVPVGAFGLGTDLPNGRRTWLLTQLGFLNRIGLWLASKNQAIAEASLDNVVSDADALPEELVDAFFTELQRPKAGRAYRSWRRAEVNYGGWNTYYYTRLDELESPALFVHGGQDDVFPARWAERAAGIAPQAEVEVFEDAAHWLPRDRPDRFEKLVTAYLRE
jgi:pimeloyl-ACP methyl ester carboxylesterase